MELEISDLSHDGRGVARLNGKTVFVSGALPGERVRAERIAKRRSFDEARLVEVLVASERRVIPRCPHFGCCGGCALQHLDATAQIESKQNTLLENLERIGRVHPDRVLPPLAESDGSFGYRRKARLGVKWVAKKNKVLVGFREAKDSRFIAEIDGCEVLVPTVGTRIKDLAALIEGLAARERIPQIEVAAGDNLTALVFRHLDPIEDSDRAALTDFAKHHDLAIFLQAGGNDSVQPLWPEDAQLRFTLPEHRVTMDFLPLDFVQINAGLNRLMIAQALELLDVGEDDSVLDLFCGIGNFSLPLARRARAVTGIEGERGLVERARLNAQRNGIANVKFFAANLAASSRDEVWFKEPYDLALLDPPRTGAEMPISELPTRSIRRLVYVSCHPGSLARDAGALVREHGFKLAAAGVMDMFPHTAHVESIALFER